MIAPERDLQHRRALALEQPCARAVETIEPQYRWVFLERGQRWSAILTINR